MIFVSFLDMFFSFCFHNSFWHIKYNPNFNGFQHSIHPSIQTSPLEKQIVRVLFSLSFSQSPSLSLTLIFSFSHVSSFSCPCTPSLSCIFPNFLLPSHSLSPSHIFSAKEGSVLEKEENLTKQT